MYIENNESINDFCYRVSSTCFDKYGFELSHDSDLLYIDDIIVFTSKGKTDSFRLIYNANSCNWYISIYPFNANEDIQDINFDCLNDALKAFQGLHCYYSLAILPLSKMY